MAGRDEFLFLHCEGVTGRTARSQHHLRNRYAQLGHISNRDCDSISKTGTVPVQISFKASMKPQSSYFGTCYRCKKRRKLAHWSHRCRPCDRDNALESQNENKDPSTELVECGYEYSPGLAYRTSTTMSSIACDISTVFGMQGCCTADRKAMQYFLNFAALDLSGYLPGRFWDGFVLQRSQCEPFVRQSVLAVANAHLDHCTHGSTSGKSLASYQAAILGVQNYIKRSERPSCELILLCCILLFTFDRLRRDSAAAAIHLESAMAIITNSEKHSKCRDNASRTGQGVINDLTVMLLQMDIEDTMPVLDRGPLLDLGVDESRYSQEPTRMTFFSPHDFMEPAMYTCHAVWAFVGRNAKYRRSPIDEVPHSVLAQRASLQRWSKAWRSACKAHINRTGALDAEDLPTTPPSEELSRRVIDAINVAIIESHYFVIKSILAEALMDTSPSRPWDRIAEKLLQCGEKALSLQRAYRKMHSLPARKTFSPHVGIVESLLLLSHRTTSPEVRFKAQRLVRGFKDVSGELSGVTAFFAGYGAPPSYLILMYERPGH